MNEPTTIGYITDDPTPDYNRGIDAAASPDDLRTFLDGWPTLAPDARAVAESITDADWPEWRRGLISERAGTFAGEAWAERFMVIVMPEPMMRASLMADQFFVPWGLAWLRSQETVVAP